MVYVGAARSLASGAGFYLIYTQPPYPFSHWAPLYPLILAAPARLGMDPAQAARAANSISLALTVFLTGLIARRHCGRAGVLAALLVLFSRDIVDIHSQALSEPLFTTLLLASVLLLLLYLGSGHTKHLLWLSAIIGLALLTRYAGAFLLISATLTIVVLGGGRWPKVRQVLLATALSALPVAAWVVRNIVASRAALGERQILFHAPQLHHFADLLTTLTLWFVPGRVFRPVLLVLPLGGCAVVLIALVRSKRLNSQSALLLRTSAIIFGIYLCSLFATVCLADAMTPFDERLLVPVYPVAILMLVSSSAIFWEIFPTRSIRYSVSFFACLALASGAARSGKTLLDTRSNGIGFQNAIWGDDEIRDYVSNLPKGILAYTDDDARAYYLTGVALHPLPQRTSSITKLANRQFQAQMAGLADYGRVIIVFDPGGLNRMGSPSIPELRDRGFSLLFRSAKGTCVMATAPEYTGSSTGP